MKPNDETIYNGMEVENEENPQVANDGKKKANWKMIGLGGATGILMGAGAIYAADAMAANADEDINSDNTNGGAAAGGGAAHHSGDADLKVANVEPGQSFSEAFAEARSEVGPGGVFHWRGGIYNTFTNEEWNAMSDEQKHDFAESVRPEYSASNVHIDPHHPQAHIVDTPHPDDPQALNVNIDEVHIHMSGDDDVHIVTPLGNEEINVGDEDAAHVEHYDVDGHHGVVVDYYDEDQHDIAIVDLNDNEVLDDGEAMDLHTGDVLDADLNPMNEGFDVDGEDMASVEHFDVDGHHGVVVDFYDEDQHDIAVVDFNDNEVLDNGEAMDLHTGDILDANLEPMDMMDLTADSADDVMDYGADSFDV